MPAVAEEYFVHRGNNHPRLRRSPLISAEGVGGPHERVAMRGSAFALVSHRGRSTIGRCSRCGKGPSC